MLQLSPAESFPIVRVLKDHTDTSTNYVQAVIRDATTDALLATINLTDQGNRRFSKVWKVTFDNAYSNGRFIVITTTVYTDSGYTTKNANYAEEAETYIVQQRWNPLYGASGGGSNGTIDYSQLKKIVVDALKEGEKQEVEPVQFPTQEILDGVKKIVQEIPEAPEAPEVDLKPLENKVDGVLEAVHNLPEPSKLDLTPALKEVRNLGTFIRDLTQEVFKQQTEIMKEQINQSKEEIIAQITNAVIKNIIAEIVAGKLRLSLFGDTNPFDGTKGKKENYLKSIQSQFK